jgi:sugar phosphate isomerase/epimerase
MKLSIVLSLQPAQFQAATFKGDLETNLGLIAALGYDGVELAIRDPKLVDPDQLEKTILKHNLVVPAIGTGQAWGEEGLSFTDPDPAIRRKAIERILSQLPLAARFGAVVIIGLIRGVVKPGVSQNQAMDWLVDALRECCAAAGPLGVRLALEPINHAETTLINNVVEGLELIERVDENGRNSTPIVDAPARDARGVPRSSSSKVAAPGGFGLLLDTYHMNIEEADMLASIKTCGSRIFHFHVADSNRKYPGGGELDFKATLSALEETGYKGWVSGEFLPSPDAETAARQGINHLKEILKNPANNLAR